MITSWQKEKRNNNENEAPQRVNARLHQKPAEVQARTGFLHRSVSTALSTQPNPHLRASSKIVQFRVRVDCGQINHAFVSKAAMSSVCTLHSCRLWRRLAKKENKHRWSPQHVQLLWRDWARQSSQVQDQSICMVHIFAGGNKYVYVPRENEHHGAHFRGWCTNSRANLCAGARLRGGGGGGMNTLLHRSTEGVRENDVYDSVRGFAFFQTCVRHADTVTTAKTHDVGSQIFFHQHLEARNTQTTVTRAAK